MIFIHDYGETYGAYRRTLSLAYKILSRKGHLYIYTNRSFASTFPMEVHNDEEATGPTDAPRIKRYFYLNFE